MGYALAHVNDRSGLIVMTIIFIILTTGTVALRFYARKINMLRFQADDWLIVVALVSLLRNQKNFARNL